MGWFSDIVGGITDVANAFNPVSSLISGGLSFLGQESANQTNIDLAEQNRVFQAQQTGTEFQRAVEDMKKAGINPMLAAKLGGNSNAPGSLATVQNAIGAGVSNALQGQQVSTAIQAQKSQAELNKALEAKAANDALLSAYNATTAGMTIKSRAAAVNAQAAADKAQADLRESLFKDPIGSGVMSAGELIRNFFNPLSRSIPPSE